MKNRQQAANRAAGIGDAEGRVVREKAANVMQPCALCQLPLRMTTRNVEAAQHVSSKHSSSTWEQCFPGHPNPNAVAEKAAKAEGPKKDLDFIRAQAAEAKSIAEGGTPKSEKKKKKKDDLSFLDAAVNNSVGKKKK
jgi:hypothetical protein